MVLWIWEDTTWSDEGAGWPNGMAQSGSDSYGVYWDVPMIEDPAKLGFVLVNAESAEKDGEDKHC